MAIFLSVTKTNKKDYVPLEQVLCIYYLLRFQKDIISIRALIDQDNKINAITLAYATKIGFKVCHINIEA